jgi:hypothetical protein
MFIGVKPEHYAGYLLQADERLDDVDGMTIESRMEEIISMHLRIPDVAQGEIDYLLTLLPQHAISKELDAVYAVQTLFRCRCAVRELLMKTCGNDVRAMPKEHVYTDENLLPNPDNDISESLWGTGNVFEDDIRESAHRRRYIDDYTDTNANEMMLRLDEIDDPEMCFEIARRRLSIMIIDNATGQQSLTQYQTSTHPFFPRLQPLFTCGMHSPDGIASVIHGLITDINQLPNERRFLS